MTSRSRHRFTSRARRALAAGTLVALTVSCGGDDSDDPVGAVAEDLDGEAGDAAEAAEERATVLADDLRASGLETVASAVDLVEFDEIVDTPNFTFLAPNDEAFQTLSADELADLLADPGQVADVLRNHAFDSRVLSGDLSDGMQIDTRAGETLTVEIDGDVVTIGGATVTEADVEVDDGVVHVVDALIIP
jgi:uncharacterized surface protein with fasciclin (FAS1) repeats